MRNNARINKPDVAENLLEKYVTVIIIRSILLELRLYLFPIYLRVSIYRNV